MKFNIRYYETILVTLQIKWILWHKDHQMGEDTYASMSMKACQVGLPHKEVTWTFPPICFMSTGGLIHPPNGTKSPEYGAEFKWPVVS